MEPISGAHAPTHEAVLSTPTRRRIPAELLPVVGSYGGGSYPTTFVGDSEPSVGLSDPGAAMRLAARVRGLDSAEFTLNGTAKGRRRERQRSEPVARDHTVELQRTRDRERDADDDDKLIDPLSPIGLL